MYKEGEILINVDLYNEIYTIEDWYEINKKSSENYKLMANLDFKNAVPNKYYLNKFYGILNGGGYTIQNIFVSQPLFGEINSKTQILNLNIKNYNLNTKIGYGALIRYGNGLTVKNVNIDTVNIKINSNYANAYAGAIIGYTVGGYYEDITLNNISISANTTGLLYIGGMIGSGGGITNNVYEIGRAHV